MNRQMQNWLWFLGIMAIVLGLGIYLGTHRRGELGQGFEYSLDAYRKVDPALIQYEEVDPLIPSITNITALAIGENGWIYVGGEKAIQVIGHEKIWSLEGTPNCLAVDAAGTLYAGMTNRIEVISREGLRREIKIPTDRTYLTSLAVDDQYIFAADAGTRKIWRFSRDEGEPFEIGHEDGPENPGFYVPSPFFDLDIGADKTLWVVNPGYHAFEQYTRDGARLSRWENSSMTIEGFCGCCNPAHFALLPDGAFVTAEKGLPRVKVHNPDGSLRCVVAAPDQFDDGIVGLDLVVDAQGRIYALDSMRKEIRIFEVKP